MVFISIDIKVAGQQVSAITCWLCNLSVTSTESCHATIKAVANIGQKSQLMTVIEKQSIKIKLTNCSLTIFFTKTAVFTACK